MWPIHLRPKDDELLSSWLVRLSWAHGLNPHTFCHLTWPRKPIWNRDIDKGCDDVMLRRLSEQTGIAPERVRATTLATYEGALTERHNPAAGLSQWLTPVGIYHRDRLRNGLQFCPLCLADDHKPYFRRRWRLAFVTVCGTHGCRLLDRCPQCGKAIGFHRDRMARSLSHCYYCGLDLGQATPMVDAQTLAHAPFKNHLLKALREGYVHLGREGAAVYSHLFFSGIYLLAKLFVGGRGKGSRLRSFFGGIMPLSEKSFTRPDFRPHFQGLDTEGRYVILNMVQWLMSNWPERFICFSRENGLTSSDLLRDGGEVPFWFDQVVKEHLYFPDYAATPQEISSAIAHLRRNNLVVTKKSISRLLGQQDVFRKRPYLQELITTDLETPTPH